MSQTDPIRVILDRIAVEHPTPAVLVGYELVDWPSGALDTFLTKGLLVETTTATSAICNGCEAECIKPVVVRPLPGGIERRAFIVCDEPQDHGRIPVTLERLRRFQASMTTVARFARICFDLASTEAAGQPSSLSLGVERGRYGPRDVSLTLRSQQVLLVVGQQEQELAQLIVWTSNQLSVDQSQFKRLKNRKPLSRAKPISADTSGASRHDAIAERDRAIEVLARKLRRQHKSWLAIAEEISRMPFVAAPKNGLRPIKADTVRRILARRMTV